MATKVRRSTGVSSIYRDAVSYVRARADRIRAGRPEDKAKKSISKWLDENGETDANGNIFYHFPAPVADTDGKLYAGVHKRYSPGDPYFLVEEVREFLRTNYPQHYDAVFQTVSVERFNEEGLYLLEQSGYVKKQEVKTLLHDGEPKYALWPITYEGEASDDD